MYALDINVDVDDPVATTTKETIHSPPLAERRMIVTVLVGRPSAASCCAISFVTVSSVMKAD